MSLEPRMLEKFDEIEERYREITDKLGDPATLSDPKLYAEYAKAHFELAGVANAIGEYRSCLRAIDEASLLLSGEGDKEMSDFLSEEIASARSRALLLEDEIKSMMTIRDPNDEKDVIMEVRAGAGGNEASLFAGQLYRMYTRYAEENGYKTDVLSSSPSDLGGFKEIIFEIRGRGAYSRLKYESGVHRVQRVPVTESGGRIHTSTVTVAVLPEVEDVEVEINQSDIRIDIFRSSGPGGQSVNTTDSAVRISHIPTGMVVSCQEERSQLQNRERAMKILRARLHDKMTEDQQSEIAESRKSQVGTGDRSERVRTYNFPQGRVTDHRIGLTLHNLESVLEGNITELIEALTMAERAAQLGAAQF